MKKVLMLAVLLGTAPLLVRADTPTGSATAVQADVSSTTQAAKKVKKHSGRKAKAEELSLFVTDDGFAPADLKVKKGKLVRLVVTRQSAQTCATSIVIPEYGISKDLPLNAPVTISFTPKKTGEINYSCGMGMVHGALSVE